MFFGSLKKEILLVTLGLTILTIIITAALGAFSTQTAVNDAEKATSDTLINQSTDSLIKLAESMAKQQDVLFENFRRDASNLASYTKNIYDNPSFFNYGDYWQFDNRVFLKDGVYLNSEDDISTFHIPNFVVLDTEEKQNIELTAGLDFIAPSLLNSNPNIAAMYTIDDKGVTRYYPNIVLGSLAPPDYDPRPDIYYKPATPEENPEKKVVWSPLYEDVAGRGLMITASAPVYTENGFRGIASVDVFLKDIIKTITEYQPIEGSYAFLIDREGNTIAFPDKAYKDVLGRSQKEGEARTMLIGSGASPEFLAVLTEMMKGEKGVGSFYSGEKELFIAYAPLSQTGSSMAVVAERTAMLKAVAALQSELSGSIRDTIVTRILPVSLLIILIATIISVIIVARVVKPIEVLKEGAREIGGGNLDYILKIKSRDEIGELASSFNQMSGALKKSRQELYEYSQGLEQKIKERTEEISEVNERLKQLDKQKDVFLSMAAHELRAPMTAIKGYVSMVLEGDTGDIPEKARGFLADTNNITDRLIRLVNNMLNVSRIEEGRMTFQDEVEYLSVPVRSVYSQFVPETERKGLKYSLKIPKQMKDRVTVDPDRIQEVIGNFISNAVKYTDEGFVEVRMSQPDKDFVRVEVADSGPGISKDEQKRLFQKFERVESNVGKTTGTGLGLYISKLLVEKFGGKIGVDSDSGKGSIFWFELPLVS